MPNGVARPWPPAYSAPPLAVWQAAQLPMPARMRPRSTTCGENAVAAGGSMGASAGRQ
ncbi:MAG: hypothetical protein RSF79_11330 [Janthinobacterium sp.]